MNIGWAIGSVVSLLLLFHLVRRVRRARACGRGRGLGRFSRGLRYVFRRLRTTKAQEKAILEVVSEVRASMLSSRDGFVGSREEVARAIAGDFFDEAALLAAFAKQDRAVANVRGEIGEALARVHAVLDGEQRAKLAELLVRGLRGPFGRPPHGPHATA